jgi:hypothetical protein
VLSLPLLALSLTLSAAQTVSAEYGVKAAYLYNFVKFVEWPDRAATGPMVICVAAHNPFGDVLADTVRGESVNGRPLEVRLILAPEPACHVVFIPAGAPPAYLRSARATPTLTVGEDQDFILQGGIIGFFLEAGNVRFEIDNDAAEHAELKISSRLLRLRRTPSHRGGR